MFLARQFSAYGPSHWGILAVFVVGAVLLVWVGRRQNERQAQRLGRVLGAVTALISEEAAMACTEAVETEIDRHYGRQLEELGDDDPELSSDIAEFRADELEHRDVAREAGAARAPAYPVLTAAIRGACRVAIGLSKRI